MSETELVERLERLETENLRLKRVGIATLLGISSMLLLAVARPPVQPDVMDGKQIVVRDPVSGNRAVKPSTVCVTQCLYTSAHN